MMDVERYVSAIVRKIKCTGARKKEIGNQLLSDIEARREQGESIEQIVESMGSVQEIAEAFCQNLSDADRRAYRRRRIAIIAGVVITVLVLITACVRWILPRPAALRDDFSEEEIGNEVTRVIDLLDQDDFEMLQEIAVDEIRTALRAEMIDQVRQDISDDWGSRQSLGHIYVQGARQFGKYIIVTQVDAIYDNVSVVYTISFDENLRLAGLYMR